MFRVKFFKCYWEAYTDTEKGSSHSLAHFPYTHNGEGWAQGQNQESRTQSTAVRQMQEPNYVSHHYCILRLLVSSRKLEPEEDTELKYSWNTYTLTIRAKCPPK